MRAFRPNPGFEKQVRSEPRYREGMRKLAAQVVDGARRNAPTGGTGAYARSLRVVEDGDIIAAATVDIAGHLVEFGSAKNPAYAPLRRGARAAGLDVRDTQQ